MTVKAPRPTLIFNSRPLTFLWYLEKRRREMPRLSVFTKEFGQCFHKNECFWYPTSLIQDHNAFKAFND